MTGLNLALFGPPGAGKGTQAKPLAAERRLLYLSTGDLLRAAAAGTSAAGTIVKRHMQAGELVPDDLVLDLVVETIERRGDAEGLLFDGFPRTTAQAEVLDATCDRLRRTPVHAVLIDVADEVLVERLVGRRICARHGHEYHLEHRPPRRPGICDVDGSPLVRRADDEPATIRRRLSVYHQQTEPLIVFYADRGRLHRVAGDGHPDEIRDEIAAVIAGTPSA